MTQRRTRLLLILVIVAAIAAIAGNARLSRVRAAAVAARDELSAGRERLADLHRWRSGSVDGSSAPATSPDTSHLTRLLRDAADQTGAADALVSIEPAAAADSDAAANFTQFPVFLRVESISMRILTLFLHRLATIDSSSRAQSIELSPAAAAGDSAEEMWNADLTIVYIHPSAREPRP